MFNVTMILAAIPTLLGSAPQIENVIKDGFSPAALLKHLPDAVSVLSNIGSALFPSAAPAITATLGALAAFGTEATKIAQQACNSILGTQLTVDGVYGPQTFAAVQALQAKLGVVVDGWFGHQTQTAAAATAPAVVPAPAVSK